MYNGNVRLRFGAVVVLGLAAAVEACGSFSAEEGAPLGGASADAAPDGTFDGSHDDPDAAPPDGALADGGHDDDAAADANADVDSAAHSVSCGSAPACPAGQGCCLTPSGQSCTAAGACPAVFVACESPSDCAGGAKCCFDSALTGTCQLSCGSDRATVCAGAGDCTIATGSNCDAVACEAGSATYAVVRICTMRVMPATFGKGGVTCTLP
ncbi:MAG: hypothetical protein QOI41_3170 [Myxococcales bacterium]|nr:hypothetical protein [Myxococcales bacterium]